MYRYGEIENMSAKRILSNEELLHQPIYQELMRIITHAHTSGKHIRFKHLRFLFCKGAWDKFSENKKQEMIVFFKEDFSDPFPSMMPTEETVISIDTKYPEHSLQNFLDRLYNRKLVDKKKNASKTVYYIPTPYGFLIYSKAVIHKFLDYTIGKIDNYFDGKANWDHAKALDDLQHLIFKKSMEYNK